MRSAMEAGEAVGAPMPFASVMRDNFLDAIAHGDLPSCNWCLRWAGPLM